MDVHEYQAKEILASHGVAIPPGTIAFSPDQAVYAATELVDRIGSSRRRYTQALAARRAGSSSAAPITRYSRRRANCWANGLSRAKPGLKASRCSGCMWN